MRTSLFVLSILAVTLIACTSTNISSQIYGSGDPHKNFERYLSEWAKESADLPAEIHSDTERAIYSLYQAILIPGNIPAIRDGYRTVVIPDRIPYYITPHGTWDYFTHPLFYLSRFHPRLFLGDTIRVLSLTSARDSTLESFLSDHSKEREMFVRQFLPLRYHSSGGTWHFATLPTLVCIVNPTFDTAEVRFRIRYDGGEILRFYRTAKVWKQIVSSRTESWIE